MYAGVPVPFSESFRPPVIKTGWLERGKWDNSQSRGEWSPNILSASSVGSSFQFSVWFLLSSFWPASGCSSPLNRKQKTLHYKAAAGSSLSRRNSDINVPRMENPQRSFPKSYVLMHACASWCLLWGKMLHSQQDSCLLLVVVWSESRGRGQQQRFIWLCWTYFCQEFPVC